MSLLWQPSSVRASSTASWSKATWNSGCRLSLAGDQPTDANPPLNIACNTLAYVFADLGLPLLFPRDGGEGEGRGVEPGADDLGVACARPPGRGGASAAAGELMAAPDFSRVAYAVVKARQAARPVASRTTPAATSCRSRPSAACGEIARCSARPRAVTTGVRST